MLFIDIFFVQKYDFVSQSWHIVAKATKYKNDIYIVSNKRLYVYVKGGRMTIIL